MIPLLAAIILAGAAGAGPVLVSDACGHDTTDNGESNRSAIAEVEKTMKRKRRPKELEVVSEGKLYAVPENVEMVSAPRQPILETWWKELCTSIMNLVERSKSEKRAAGDDESCTCQPESSTMIRRKSSQDMLSKTEQACQICFEHEHSAAVLPCGHGGMCWDCGVQMYALTEECPMCRSKIDLIVSLDGDARRREESTEYVGVVCA